MTASGHIWWLASYPKSGNTWMRLLLANYLSAGDRPISINSIPSAGIASARWLFDSYVGVEASDLTPDEVVELRPAVYRFASDSVERSAHPGSRPTLVKVHDGVWSRPGELLFPAEASAGAIYLVRNPLDVLASFAAHMGRSFEETARRMADPDFSLAGAGGELGQQLEQRLGTWSDHVEGWCDSPIQPLIVRYEDLHDDPNNVLNEVIAHLGMAVDEAAVARAVAAASFGDLAAQEAADGFAERPARMERFFRRGVVGGWRDELPVELVRDICRDHGRVMERFGYMPEQ